MAYPRRYFDVAAVAGDCGFERKGGALGGVARRPAAGDIRRFAVGAFNSRWFVRNPEEAPIIFRPPVDALARDFVYFFAIGPALAGSLIAGLFDLNSVVGGAGIVLLMSGLAAIVATGDLIYLRRQRILRSIWAAAVVAPALMVVVTTLFLPWAGGAEVATSLPGKRHRAFFWRQF